jgi:hypothetical protein
MEILLVWFLAGLFMIWAAVGLLRRSPRSARWPRAPRVVLILLALTGAYMLLLLAVFFLQPLFNG